MLSLLLLVLILNLERIRNKVEMCAVDLSDKMEFSQLPMLPM
jgi:hypothetical protein